MYTEMYTVSVKDDARQALETIRDCVVADRIRLTQHFLIRLAERDIYWTDVLTVIDSPRSLRGDGVDDAGRPRWLISGTSVDGIEMEIVCAIGRDMVIFITIYWED